MADIKLLDRLKVQLTRDEGLRLKPYTDTVGKLTIGVGRNLTDKGIAKIESDFLLENDLQQVLVAVDAALPWATALTEARRGVLMNMAFNMGIGGLLGFPKMLLHLRYGRYQEAAWELLNSKYAIQVGDRAKRLARQLVDDQWQ
jgi:lysozyme